MKAAQWSYNLDKLRQSMLTNGQYQLTDNHPRRKEEHVPSLPTPLQVQAVKRFKENTAEGRELWAEYQAGRARMEQVNKAKAAAAAAGGGSSAPVSYTHLTLPTKA